MKIALYADAVQEMGNRLEGMIQDELPQIRIEKMNSIGYLKEKLCRPLNRISVIVVFVIYEKDLYRLFPLKPLFDDIRLILILPDSGRDLTALGLGLNPCFVGYSDSDPADIVLVLKKIGQRRKNNIIR
nr:hypothetical protein [Desulfobacula sp.]